MIVILMGVAGSGKTTIGKLLAAELGWSFFDADSFHPPANVEKMRNGIPLDDADRAPWLAAMAGAIRGWIDAGTSAVLACSALKERYRAVLMVKPSEIRLVYLKGSPELIASRLEARQGHFFHKDLLPSQLATLEEPRDAIVVDVAASPEECVAQIRAGLLT